MPREIIMLPVGQCGNQIAWRFWDIALREHAMHSKPGVYDEGMSTFFANVREEDGDDGPVSSVGRRAAAYGAQTALRRLKARAVLVDMEEGVVSQVLRSPIGDLFDRRQLITDVSGAGNNWAHGFHAYGPRYREDVLEQVRAALEAAESPQSFFFLHSMGGGTGSGLGTYMLAQLADAYPELYRFTCAVFPSADDDVITSPYNFALAYEQLQEHADCILPLENQALLDVVNAIDRGSTRKVAATALRTAASPVLLTSTLTYVPPAPLKASRLVFAPDTDTSRKLPHTASSPGLRAPRGDAGVPPRCEKPAARRVVADPVPASTPTRPPSAPKLEAMDTTVLAAAIDTADAALARAMRIAASQPSPARADAEKKTTTAAQASAAATPSATSATRGRVVNGKQANGPITPTRTPGAPAGARTRSAAQSARGPGLAAAPRRPAVGIIPGLVDPRDKKLPVRGKPRTGPAPTSAVGVAKPTTASTAAAPPVSKRPDVAPEQKEPEIGIVASSIPVSGIVAEVEPIKRVGVGCVELEAKVAEADEPDLDADDEASESMSQAPSAKSRRAGTAFDAMNNVAAHLVRHGRGIVQFASSVTAFEALHVQLTHLTASMRFEGALNVDLNEITTTLVPFPNLKLLQSSISPLFALSDVGGATVSRRIDGIFNDAFVRGHQLVRGDPKTAVHLACGLFLRGDIALSDAVRNVERLKSELRMVSWNPDGFKLGMCSARPVHQPYSLLSLSNNTSVVPTLQAAHDRFMHLYRVRAHIHHYTEFMDFEGIKAAGAALTDSISAYNELDCERDL